MRNIHINQLSQHFITRKRGLEAYMKLYRHLNLGPVILNLNKVDIISYSFLDEIILMAAKTSKLDKLVFDTSSKSSQDNLARIAGVRKIHIKVMTSTNSVREIKPKSFLYKQAIYVNSK